MVIGILTIGTVEFDSIRALVGGLLSDPTFTGRDEIWRFALDHIAERPVVGFGFQAFWGTSELVSMGIISNPGAIAPAMLIMDF